MATTAPDGDDNDPGYAMVAPFTPEEQAKLANPRQYGQQPPMAVAPSADLLSPASNRGSRGGTASPGRASVGSVGSGSISPARASSGGRVSSRPNSRRGSAQQLQMEITQHDYQGRIVHSTAPSPRSRGPQGRGLASAMAAPPTARGLPGRGLAAATAVPPQRRPSAQPRQAKQAAGRADAAEESLYMDVEQVRTAQAKLNAGRAHDPAEEDSYMDVEQVRKALPPGRPPVQPGAPAAVAHKGAKAQVPAQPAGHAPRMLSLIHI